MEKFCDFIELHYGCYAHAIAIVVYCSVWIYIYIFNLFIVSGAPTINVDKSLTRLLPATARSIQLVCAVYYLLCFAAVRDCHTVWQWQWYILAPLQLTLPLHYDMGWPVSTLFGRYTVEHKCHIHSHQHTINQSRLAMCMCETDSQCLPSAPSVTHVRRTYSWFWSTHIATGSHWIYILYRREIWCAVVMLLTNASKANCVHRGNKEKYKNKIKMVRKT